MLNRLQIFQTPNYQLNTASLSVFYDIQRDV